MSEIRPDETLLFQSETKHGNLITIHLRKVVIHTPTNITANDVEYEIGRGWQYSTILRAKEFHIQHAQYISNELHENPTEEVTEIIKQSVGAVLRTFRKAINDSIDNIEEQRINGLN